MALGGGSSGGGARGVRAGAAYVELNGKDNLSGFLKRMKAKVVGAVKAIGAAAVVGFGAGLAGVGLLAGPLIETLTDLRKVDDVAKAFGITGRAASGLFGVLGAVGGVFKENIEGVVQFSGTMDKAFENVGQGAELFNGLNITAKELAGLGIDEQFYRVLGAIRELPQGLQEAKLSMLGGSDSLKQWQQLLSMSEAEVRALAARLSFSNAELRRAADAGRAYQRAVQSVGRAWQQIAVGVAPLIEQIANMVERAADGFTQWIRGRSAGNLLAELWVQARIGIQESLSFLRDGATAVWKYVTSPGNLSKFADYLWKLVKSLVGYVIKSLATAVPIITQGLARLARNMLQASATIKLASGDKQGADEDIRAARILSNPLQMRRNLEKAMALDAKAFDQARGDLGDEFDDIYKQFLKSQRANSKQDALGRARLNRELAGVLAEANKERTLARWAEQFGDWLDGGTKPPIRPEAVASLGRSLGTFGAGDFLRQGFGVRGTGDPVVKSIEKGNKESAKQTGLLQNLIDRAGPLLLT